MALRAYTSIELRAKETFLSILIWFLNLVIFTVSDAHIFSGGPSLDQRGVL